MPGPSEPYSQPEAQRVRAFEAVRARADRLMGQMRGDGLRARALRGSTWTVAGFGASQVLRLGSNLILTRLLFPEAFGLMALAQVFMQGLNMLSDIGVGPSIVQNERGDDPDFLATAWTMQVIRGFTLFLCMCAIAYPASLFYDQPILFPILVLLGTTSIIQGFQSIGISTASRKMALGRLTMLDLISQSVSIAVIIVWAYFSRDVWAIVGGGIIGGIVRVVLGHQLLGSRGNRIHFERSAAHEIFHFGKWIFLATAMTYFGGQGIRLFQGMLVPVDVLGRIAIAGSLAGLLVAIIGKIGSSVLFPVFAEAHRSRPEKLRRLLKESRLKMFAASLPVYMLFILFGRHIIDLMYDPRYAEAGLYLVVIATGGAIVSVRMPFGMTLMSVGDSFGHSVNMAIMAAAKIAAILIGFGLSGVVGMLIADVLSNFVVYPFEALRLRRVGLWMPGFDLSCFSLYLLVGAFSIWWNL